MFAESRVFDVYDPFDQINYFLPEVGLIDNDMNGPDNRLPGGGVDPAVGIYQAVTDADGKASVTITVSMQPGNNYRAGASVLQDAIGQATQSQADLVGPGYPSPGSYAGYSLPLHWSPMLTVWRKLHVETDTMVRPTFPQNTYQMQWDNPRTGPTSTQVLFDVNDPAGGFQTEDARFERGYVELQNAGGTAIVTGRILEYTTVEFPFGTKDVVKIHIPDCGGGQSGLACLGGVPSGNAVFSDDDIQNPKAF